MKVFVIHKNPTSNAPDIMYRIKQVRGQNRQLYKLKLSKGGTRKANKAEKHIFGFQLFDKVKYKGQECFIFGRRKSGNFDIRLLNNITINANANYKKLKLLDKSSTILIERIASNV